MQAFTRTRLNNTIMHPSAPSFKRCPSHDSFQSPADIFLALQNFVFSHYRERAFPDTP